MEQSATPQAEATKQLEKKHPLATRWMHWINFPVMLVLTWSGLLLYWENNNYSLKIGPYTLFHLFPRSFYEALHLTNRNSEGLAWHLLFMWFFAINGVLYVLYTAISGQWRHLLPDRRSLRRAWQVVLHDLHLSKFAPPQGKYNGAQKIAYTAVVVMGFLELVTGFALWKPDDLGWLALPFGGLAAAKFVHFWLTIAFTLYFVIHVAQVIRAGWGNFRSMITGYEVVPVLPSAVVSPSAAQAPAVGTGSVVAGVPVDLDEPPLERLPPGREAEVEGQMRRMSSRSFLYAGAAILLTLGAWRWAMSQSANQGVPPWLEWAAESNEEEHEKEGKEAYEREHGGAAAPDSDRAEPDKDAAPDADRAEPDRDAAPKSQEPDQDAR